MLMALVATWADRNVASNAEVSIFSARAEPAQAARTMDPKVAFILREVVTKRLGANDKTNARQQVDQVNELQVADGPWVRAEGFRNGDRGSDQPDTLYSRNPTIVP